MSMTQEQINADLFDQCKRLQAELATLRAKAEAYDKGVEMVELSFPRSTVHMLVEPSNQAVISIYEKSKGHTCRKVRVCEVVVAGEKPALANNEKDRL